MDDSLNVEFGCGVTVEGNDLLLDPASLLPPPAMRGTITSVRIEHGMMVQVFGSGTPWPPRRRRQRRTTSTGVAGS